MIINSEVFDYYLENQNIDKYEDYWLFKCLSGLSGEMNVFKKPSYSPEDIQTMARISKEIQIQVKDFKPNNIEIWNILFPKWMEAISDVTVYFIVGLPEGYDALALRDESENSIVVYDIGNWLIYKSMNISDVANNLLTHELCHVCIHSVFPDIKKIYMSGTYTECLNAIAFNEGFAHLLAFENKNIDSVDWKSEKYNKLYNSSLETMKEALLEEDIDKQKQYIQGSMSGSYYGKFGAMLGMLYLANIWLEHGNIGIKKVFYEGYSSFASKVINET